MLSTGLNIEMLRHKLTGRLVGSRLHYHQVLGSTMDEAHSLAQLESPEGTVVVAEEQTAGRGRFNRAWVSPPGQKTPA